MNKPSLRGARTLIIANFTASLFATSMLTASPALALDAVDFFNAMQAQAEAKGSKVTFGSLEAMGSDGARATGITIDNPKDKSSMMIGEMTLSGAEQMGEKAFAFDSLEASDITINTVSKRDDAPVAVRIGSISATGFNYPEVADRKLPLWPFEIDTGEITGVSITNAGKEGVTLNLPSMAVSGLKQHGENSFDLASLTIEPATGSFTASTGGSGEISIGAFSLSDFSLFGLGAYSIGNGHFDGMSLKGTTDQDQAFDFQMGAIDVAGLFSPDFSEGKEFSMPDGEMSATIGPMQLGIDGKQLMTFAGGKSNGRYDSATQVYSGEGTLDGLYINVMEFPVKPEQRKGLEQFAALGYDSVTLNGEFAGSWNVAEGTLDMTKYRLSADDMAAFDMAVSLGGYTIELGRQLQKISQAMNGAEDDETRQALSFQMLAAMSALTVREIRLTLEDDSLTGRVLEMQAAKAGQKKEDLVAAAPFMIGAMMGPLEIPEFASALSAAVGSFMSNPGKLTLSAKPGAPVSVAEIMGLGAAVKAGSVKPSEVIERFNVAVEAN